MNALSAVAPATIHSRFRYRCSQCDKIHHGLPNVCFPTPDCVRDLPQKKFDESCLISEDVCIVDGTSFYIYCVLEVPVVDYPDRFGWGVWCQTSWTPFKMYWESLSITRSDRLPIAGARLSNDLAHMPSTTGTRCEIHFRKNGARPIVKLPPSKHRLYNIQQHGLSVDQAVAQAQSVGTLLLVA